MSWKFQLLNCLANSWEIFTESSLERMSLVLKIGVKFYGSAGIHGVIFMFLFTRNCFNIGNLLFQLWNLFFEKIDLFDGQIGLSCGKSGRKLWTEDKVPWSISGEVIFITSIFLREGIKLKGRVPGIAFLIFVVD